MIYNFYNFLLSLNFKFLKVSGNKIKNNSTSKTDPYFPLNCVSFIDFASTVLIASKNIYTPDDVTKSTMS